MNKLGPPQVNKGQRKPRPTACQVRSTNAVVGWYLQRSHLPGYDNGFLPMFCDRERVGPFAVRKVDALAGRPAALFKMLVATAMFQAQRDVQVQRILTEMPAADACLLSSKKRLLVRAQETGCSQLSSNSALLSGCDLGKDPVTKKGFCSRHPRRACHLKQDTEVLRRYGNFGKMPTSIALVLRETGAKDLRDLRRRVLLRTEGPRQAALELEAELCRAWRVDKKLANMFLSAISNPDLCGGTAPWSEGIDWTWFVVIDRNVDRFLEGVGYLGPWTYEARRRFLLALARKIDLRGPGHKPQNRYNPRLMQQALYAFMSRSNRRANLADCCHEGEQVCRQCPAQLSKICTATQC